MYRVSSFVRRFAKALVAGAVLATVWVNLDPARYYDAIEFHVPDGPKPDEIVFIVAAAIGGRPHSRVGGLTVEGIKLGDGQR